MALTFHEPTETIPANRYVYVFKKRPNKLFPIADICKFKSPVIPAELSFDGDIVFAWTFARDFCNESGVLLDSIRRIKTTKSHICNLWQHDDR